jgi:hypothetical protein
LAFLIFCAGKGQHWIFQKCGLSHILGQNLEDASGHFFTNLSGHPGCHLSIPLSLSFKKIKSKRKTNEMWKKYFYLTAKIGPIFVVRPPLS